MLGIFLDSETNGLNARKNRIVEIAFKMIDVETGVLVDEFQSLIAISLQEWEASDRSSLNINGFKWEELEHAPSLETVAEQVQSCFVKNGIKRGSSVFICQNPSFDRAFFAQLIDPDSQEKWQWPYHWLDLASMFWAESLRKAKEGQSKLPWETGLSKDKIAKTLNLPSEKSPHRAMNGVNHLIQCYEALIGFSIRK